MRDVGGLKRTNPTPQPSITIPVEPPEDLIMSMAVRYDHGLGCPGYYDQEIYKGQPTHQQRLECTLRTMRQLYEEVAGTGFYKWKDTPQPSDVGEVVEQIEKLLCRNSACAMLYCTYPIGKHSDNCPVPAVLAAVRTLAGELKEAKREVEQTNQLLDCHVGMTDLAHKYKLELTDAQAGESRMQTQIAEARAIIRQVADSVYSNAFVRDAFEWLQKYPTALAGAGEGKGDTNQCGMCRGTGRVPKPYVHKEECISNHGFNHCNCKTNSTDEAAK